MHGSALVLGGGGSVGNAWLLGVVAGLAAAGVDVTRADLVVGTSAGATAAAQVTAADPGDLYADVLAATPPARTPRSTNERDSVTATSVASHLDRTNAIIAAAVDAADMRRRLGAAALELASGDASARWRATVAARLPRHEWPDQRMLITAVDATSGEAVVLDRESGLDLVDAVAASCAGGPAYTVGDRSFIDGGYRSNADNADLAAGHARILVLSPFGGRSRTPAGWGLHLADQVDRLRAGGSWVETIFPDEAALAAFGDNMMDLSRRAPAAQAGFDQGRAHGHAVGVGVGGDVGGAR